MNTPPPVSQRWMLLAVVSLGLSAVAALALALARTPVLTALVGANLFPRALVVHVNLATLIWYLAMAAALWTERLPASRATNAAFVLATAGVFGVVATGFTATGAPVLANYVPYLDSPAFLASLAAFAAGGLATALLSLQRPACAVEWGFALARVPFVMGAAYLLLELGRGGDLVAAVWGAGHVLQFGYVTLLMAIWLRIVERAGARPLPTAVAAALFAAAALPSLLGPLLLLTGTAAGELHAFHTELMRVANWPAPLLFALVLLSRGRSAWRAAGFVPSVGLFAIGIAAGAAIDAQTTMVPAHYHGTIGAFTLALMAAALARVSPAPASRTHRPLGAYALANTLLIAGLAWSGALGAPRKTGFAGGADLAPTLSAALTGIGGIATVAAVVYFVTVLVPRIFSPCSSRPLPPPPARAATFAPER